jgi:hypothetical protein
MGIAAVSELSPWKPDIQELSRKPRELVLGGASQRNLRDSMLARSTMLGVYRMQSQQSLYAAGFVPVYS